MGQKTGQHVEQWRRQDWVMRFEMRTSSCLLFAHGLIIIIMHDLDASKALRQYALGQIHLLI